MSKIPLRILLATPDLFGAPGGIARFTRLVCKALSESALVERLDVIALNDTSSQKPDTYYLQTSNSSYVAANTSKAHFIYQLLRLVPYAHNIYLTTHVNLTPALWPLYQLNRKQSVLVTVAHGIDVWDRLSWSRRLPLANSSMILSVSDFTQERMVRANDIYRAKVSILHNCLDPRFEIAENLNEKSNVAGNDPIHKPTILTVSRLSKYDRYKGHTQVIHALAQIYPQIPTVQYYIVGEGELTSELHDLSEKLGVTKSVHFLGRVDESRLHKLYLDADLFVMPSRGEGFGLVYLEAMACGTPVIASNQDAAGEVVRHGETGLLVDPNNVSGLANSMLQLLTDDALRQQMGKRGKEVANTQFSYNRFQDKLLTYLQNALNDLKT